MSFMDFDEIEGKPFMRKCITCGAEVPTGIFTISEHWVSCTGKAFYGALMNNPKGGRPTLEDLEAMRKQHLNPTHKSHD